jgi:hypothetical protein
MFTNEYFKYFTPKKNESFKQNNARNLNHRFTEKGFRVCLKNILYWSKKHNFPSPHLTFLVLTQEK